MIIVRPKEIKASKMATKTVSKASSPTDRGQFACKVPFHFEVNGTVNKKVLHIMSCNDVISVTVSCFVAYLVENALL